MLNNITLYKGNKFIEFEVPIKIDDVFKAFNTHSMNDILVYGHELGIDNVSDNVWKELGVDYINTFYEKMKEIPIEFKTCKDNSLAEYLEWFDVLDDIRNLSADRFLYHSDEVYSKYCEEEGDYEIFHDPAFFRPNTENSKMIEFLSNDLISILDIDNEEEIER